MTITSDHGVFLLSRDNVSTGLSSPERLTSWSPLTVPGHAFTSTSMIAYCPGFSRSTSKPLIRGCSVCPFSSTGHRSGTGLAVVADRTANHGERRGFPMIRPSRRCLSFGNFDRHRAKRKGETARSVPPFSCAARSFPTFRVSIQSILMRPGRQSELDNRVGWDRITIEFFESSVSPLGPVAGQRQSTVE